MDLDSIDTSLEFDSILTILPLYKAFENFILKTINLPELHLYKEICLFQKSIGLGKIKSETKNICILYLGYEGQKFKLNCIKIDDPIVKTTLSNVENIQKLKVNDLKKDVFNEIKEVVEKCLKEHWKEFLTSLEYGKLEKKKDLDDLLTEGSPEEQFEHILQIEPLYRDFIEYLRNLLANENLEFYKAVNEYKKKIQQKKNSHRNFSKIHWISK